MSENSLDGMRRYDDIVREISDKADEALALALGGAVSASNSVLDIALWWYVVVY